MAAASGCEAVAMTDHDALTGAVRFARACRDAGVKPIFGAELSVARAGTIDRGKPPLVRSPGANADGLSHVTVIARDKTGYANLCRLITAAHMGNRDRPATTMDAIAERAEGVFVFSGCERSEVARLAAAGARPEAEAAAKRWRDAIGPGYRIEVFDHRGYGSRTLRNRLLAIAHETGIRAVATNDVHYGIPEHAIVHELLHAIKEIVPLSSTRALRATSEYDFKDAASMRALFADAPEAADETLAIASACDFELELGVYHLPRMEQGGAETPAQILTRRCRAGVDRRYPTVTREVEDRLHHELDVIFRLGWASYFLLVADIVHHVRNVLGIRCSCRGSAAGSLVCYVLGISDVDPVRYDLLFERFMNARREELPDIDVDVESYRREEVLEYILQTYGAEQTAICCMVDTFRARMAIREVGKALGMPADEIDAVAKAFPRVAARDIPAAIERQPELAGTNIAAGQLDRLFELCLAIDGFPRHLALHPSGVVLSSADLGDRVPMQPSYGGFTMLQADKDDVEELGLVKLDVLGVRMLSSLSHAVTEIKRARDVDVDIDRLPHDDADTFKLIRSSRTIGCFQIESPGQRELLARFQPNRFEDLIVDISLFRPGPVKSDMISPFLDRRHGFQEVRYPHPKLAPILAETHGVIVYHEQLIRAIASVTGCSLADADYVRRHLEPDAEFLGVAGPIDIHAPDAVNVSSEKQDMARWFKSATIANGLTPAQAEKLWKEVFSFASFGFCKSHAAAFAVPTYISAWLKAHYPAEFYAGVLTHEPGMYPRRLIVADARQSGVPILPVDVNASDAVYRVEPVETPQPATGAERPPRSEATPAHLALTGLEQTPPERLDQKQPAPQEAFAEAGRHRAESPPGASAQGAINPARSDSNASEQRQENLSRRAGEGEQGRLQATLATEQQRGGLRLALSTVRDMSAAEIESLLTARAERPFTSLEDLWRRTSLSRPVLENLVHVGALSSIETTRSRRELLWQVIELTSKPRPVSGVQLELPLDAPITESLPGLSAYTAFEETQAEIEVAGIDARRHLMDLYRPLLGELGCVASSGLHRIANDRTVWVAGVKVASQTPAIRSGQRIIFVTLDDPTGPVDVTVFERVQPRCARTVFHCWLLLVRGTLRKRGGASMIYPTDPRNVGMTVVAEEVFDLARLAEDRAAGRSLSSSLAQQRRHQLAGIGAATAAPRRLWHSSGGSAGG